MSKQTSNFETSEEILKHSSKSKKKLWSLYMTFKSFRGEEVTYKSGKYLTEKVAICAGEQLLRKHPTLYIKFKIKYKE